MPIASETFGCVRVLVPRSMMQGEKVLEETCFPALLRKHLNFNGSAYGNRTRLTADVVLSGS